MAHIDEDEQLLDYEDEQEETVDAAEQIENGVAGDAKKIKVRIFVFLPKFRQIYH